MTDRYENRCSFIIAWAGQCKSVADQSGFCEEHRGKKCDVCGKQATHECSYEGQFVCGAPLCDSCEGYTDKGKPRGAWGFLNHGHRKKEDRND